VSSYNKFYNWLWFGNGYHAEHHYRPRLHWTKYPQFHEQIRAEQKSGGCSHHQHLPRAGFSRERESGNGRRHEGLQFLLGGNQRQGVLLCAWLTGGPTEMKFIGKRLHKRGFTVYARHFPDIVRMKGHCSGQSLRIGWGACENPCIFSVRK